MANDLAQSLLEPNGNTTVPGHVNQEITAEGEDGKIEANGRNAIYAVYFVVFGLSVTAFLWENNWTNLLKKVLQGIACFNAMYSLSKNWLPDYLGTFCEMVSRTWRNTFSRNAAQPQATRLAGDDNEQPDPGAVNV